MGDLGLGIVVLIPHVVLTEYGGNMGHGSGGDRACVMKTDSGAYSERLLKLERSNHVSNSSPCPVIIPSIIASKQRFGIFGLG